MDLLKVIQELTEEKARLDAMIANLEALIAARKLTGERRVIERALKHRGRRVVSDEERAEISQRMRDYWAARRKVASEVGDGSSA
jgi:hypothetical protein